MRRPARRGSGRSRTAAITLSLLIRTLVTNTVSIEMVRPIPAASTRVAGFATRNSEERSPGSLKMLLVPRMINRPMPTPSAAPSTAAAVA